MKPNLPEYVVAFEPDTDREFVIRLHEPRIVWEFFEHPDGVWSKMIDHQISREDIDAATLARFSREAGDAYRAWYESIEDEDD